MNEALPLPFRHCWNRQIFRDDFNEKRPLCFVFSSNYSWLGELHYFDYLRDKYPGCRLVMTLRDTVRHAIENYPGFYPWELQDIFDLVLTSSLIDANEYGFDYYMFYYSQIQVERSPDYPLSDVVFIGQAKDRLDTVISACRKFVDAGLKCDFYITGVPEAKRTPIEGITYAEKPMSYTEMLFRTVNSRCVLEATQFGTNSFTSRYFESVCYDRKLITNNPLVLKTDFYGDNRIQYYSVPEEIDPAFVRRGEDACYGYTGEYSPVHFLELLEDKFTGREPG
jgi:hypothetical protein